MHAGAEDLEAILKQENLIAHSLDELGAAEAIAMLVNADISVHPDQFDDALVKDTIRTIVQVKHIQGQTITSLYGAKAHFIHNYEQLLTAGLSSILLEQENSISDGSRQLIDKLAQLSFEKYTALKNHDLFVAYLKNKSTLNYYGRTTMGSRPYKRGDKEKLNFDDLRAIAFVGSWSQLKQNVPGYYGIGTAIQTVVDDGKTIS